MNNPFSKNIVFRFATEADIPRMRELETGHADAVLLWNDEEHYRALQSNNDLQIMVDDSDTHENIGYLLFGEMRNKNRSIYLSRFLIAVKNQGYGSATMDKIKAFVFNELKLHRLWLEANCDNHGAKRFYERHGLRREGTLRDNYINSVSGQFYSTDVYSMLEHEYQPAP